MYYKEYNLIFKKKIDHINSSKSIFIIIKYHKTQSILIMY